MTLPGTELKHYFQPPHKTKKISVACVIPGSFNPNDQPDDNNILDIEGLKTAFRSKLDLIIFPENSGQLLFKSFLKQYADEKDDEKKKEIFPQDDKYNPIVVYGTPDALQNAVYVEELFYDKEKKNLETKILYTYDKLNSLPFGLGPVYPGKNSKTPYPESFKLGKFGTKTSAAICYDFSNPETIRKLSWPGVDMMINIAHTAWVSFGTPAVKESRYRAVENGFSLIQCNSVGEVLYSTPFGDIYYEYGLERPELQSFVQFDIENPKGVFTFYKYGGFVFPWLCMCILIVFNIYDIYRYFSQIY